ncbi:murein DD-endopeptidase MepM/ murein hydrolase activator NlpD [Rhizobium leguminosarum]|uniref:Murein DD-endopeptidase MepM/ murein hydrolase activator NlpD n=1 Tax=Rhizobium leguminosarum TaxID=384 RepID=A0AAE2T0C0_RHILE|nr:MULTISPECIES: M23 family metallopeptidase [Rhizobium]MBB4294295.1 murein DD-endopeptidase MepM/ murein hydrolase activator NlpD [Rhizobium leguminosarum]MBB5681138.1 murein DD-endopeptidase MepM/ murein hydrolase activator NlpD [Rhizobium leguminosarum]MDC7746989.1 M23 family metallopeptidase [Rhizobium sp. BC56]MDC9813814.1 M23 family metallopeptidase [Rhizobium sp. MC62]MDC9837762.1 M23 family metallopeptidase [Rhizobium sp. MJ37]
MMTEKMMIRSLGNEPPLLADGRRAPDRREVSLRWLSGTFLTGITSSVLMGVALFAALDGRQQLAIPAEAYASAAADAHEDTAVVRGGRLIAPAIAAKPSDRAIMEVSTVVHDGEKEVVRRQPFAHVKMTLAANHVATEDYPDFDPLAIFSADEPQPAPQSRTGALYGSDVESEVSLKTIPFPTGKTSMKMAAGLSLEEVEENVRSNGSVLTDGNTQLAALYYVDPRRFSNEDADVDLTAGLSARVLEQNMTVSASESITPQTEEFADDILPVRVDTPIAKALTDSGYPQQYADGIAGFISQQLGSTDLDKGDVLRIGIIQKGEQAKIIRASVYRGTRHLVTVAVDDKGRYVPGSEPPMLDAIATAFDDNSFAPPPGQNLPRVYDGIYRAALSYGMTKDMTALIIKLLASNVDFQAQLRSTDSLEAFFSVADSAGQATEDSELLYVNARFGDTQTRFYRFQDPDDGTVDYFDENGKSIRQFLLRNPVPNGIFKSGFGMRRHPILGFARMHTGVDWAAPRGTAIIAAGNGTVEKAGWDSGGYGNQTIIRHANGYESSYNHQSAIAKGVIPGAKIRQGQVIGWVGTTGESTGPHLHYELIVNGTKVDPLRIRLPGGKSLQGEALAKFEDERKRIDTLLNNQTADQVASK